MQACDRCHSRKTRCDRRIPQCSSCEKAGAPCLHADKLRQRNLPRAYIDNIENMVAQLREENQVLRRNLAAAEANVQALSHVEAQLNIHADVYAQVPPGLTPETMASIAGDVQRPRSNSVAATTQLQTHETLSVASSTRGSPPGDPFALEMGYLTLTATGETRYLGPSSGMDLASLVSTVFSTRNDNLKIAGDICGNRGGNSNGNRRRSLVVPSDLKSLFPSLTLAMPFIESYFQHTHITFPLLHRPSFMQSAARIFTEPGYYENNHFDAFVLEMVMAIGGSNINRFEESTSISNKCFSLAQLKLKTVMEMGGQHSLTAILLISHHGIFSSLCDTSASIWHLVGIGARICIELGLHLNQRHLKTTISGEDADQDRCIITMEEEMRRRCFWCLYNLDRVVSFTLGRPVVIRDEELDVPLPSPMDDDSFGPNCPIIVEPGLDETDHTRNQSSPFLHITKIRRLSGQILGNFYNSRHLSDFPMEEKRRVRRQFDEKLQEWRRDTKNLGLLNNNGQGTMSSYLSPEYYSAVYSNAVLLLYRPSPYMPHPSMMADSEGEMTDLLKLFHAARNSIMSYSELHRKRRLNYSWITMHGVFISGLAFIYCVGRILQDSSMRDLQPDFITIVDVTRACSNVLVAICERWNVSRRSCELFNKLSNAVIHDALHATIRRDSGSVSRTGITTAAPEGCTAETAQQISQPQQQDTETPSYEPSSSVDITGQIQTFDEMLVMDEFRQFSGTFENAAPRDLAYPSEMAFSFLQDWPFDLPFNSITEEGMATPVMDTQWQ